MVDPCVAVVVSTVAVVVVVVAVVVVIVAVVVWESLCLFVCLLVCVSEFVLKGLKMTRCLPLSSKTTVLQTL